MGIQQAESALRGAAHRYAIALEMFSGNAGMLERFARDLRVAAMDYANAVA